MRPDNRGDGEDNRIDGEGTEKGHGKEPAGPPLFRLNARGRTRMLL